MRIAEVYGPVVYKMSQRGLHLSYKKELIEYYREICNHKQESIRKWAVYHLPCMNLLFKDCQVEMDIDFKDLYLKFSEDEDFDIRYCAATSLHEAF